MTVQQALEKSKNDIFGQFSKNTAAKGPSAPPKKKRSMFVWIAAILVGVIIFAMKMGW